MEHTPKQKALTQEEKVSIKKAVMSLKTAGSGASALAWISLFVWPLVVLASYWNEVVDKPVALVLIFGIFFLSSIVLFLGKYTQIVFKKYLRTVLWFLLLVMLSAFISLLSILVAIYLIIALVRLRKLRKADYFKIKVQENKKVDFSKKEIVAIAIAGLLTLSVAIWAVTKGVESVKYDRGKFVAECLSGASSEDRSNNNFEAYCGCVYDDGLQQLGHNEFVQALIDLYDTNETPASLQPTIDTCSQQL